MPELPEVETTRCGIAPHLEGRRIEALEVRERRLRWPIPDGLEAAVAGLLARAIERRGKYLLLRLGEGTLLIHLGMSGSLRRVAADEPPRPHDHYDLIVAGGYRLRYHDPRRFGALLWYRGADSEQPLLAHLGPEPFAAAFDGGHLFRAARGRRGAIKNLIMDGRVVVGVGNIYANEALFLAGIHPARAAGRIGRARCDRLADAIRAVLASAIAAGGTTLRDFVGSEGRPGYFAQRLRVYGREGLACPGCGATLRGRVIGQRATVYCPRCQR